MTLIEGIQLDTDSSLSNSKSISLRFLTVVPFFKVIETYPLAHPIELSRRDLKSGKQRFKAQLLLTTTNNNNDQHQLSPPPFEPTVLVVTSEWRDPNAGSLDERYELVSSNILQCTSTLKVTAGSATARRVFKRSTKGWTPKQLWNPLF
jgi:hypothetical protein